MNFPLNVVVMDAAVVTRKWNFQANEADFGTTIKTRTAKDIKQYELIISKEIFKDNPGSTDIDNRLLQDKEIKTDTVCK